MGADELSVALRGADGDDAHPAALGQSPFVEGGPLAVAILGTDQVRALFIHDFEAVKPVALAQPNAAHTPGHAPLVTQLRFLKAIAHAVLGGQNELIAAVGQLDIQQLVILVNVDRDDAILADVDILRQVGLLDDALAGSQDHELRRIEIADGHGGGNGFILPQVQQVDDGFSTTDASAFRDLVDHLPVDPSAARKEEHAVMRGGHEQVFHEVFLAGGHAGDALSSAFLGAVGVDGDSLDVSGVADRDDAGLVRDQVQNVDIVLRNRDFGPSLVTVAFLQIGQLVLDQIVDLFRVAQQVLQVGDQLLQLFVFGLDLFAFQPRELVESHFENGLGLYFAEIEGGYQRVTRLVAAAGGTDNPDDLVQVVQGLKQAFQDMRARLGLGQLVTEAAGDDLEAVLDELGQDFFERHHLRAPIDDGQHDGAKGCLQHRVLVEVTQNDVAHDAFLEFDDDADRFLAIGFITQVGNAFNDLFLHQVCHRFNQPGLVDHVGQFADQDGVFAGLFIGDDFGAAPHAHLAAARLVHLFDGMQAADDAFGGEVRPLDKLHQVGDRGRRMVDQVCQAVHQFAQVVGRDVGGHTHGDSRGAVQQQVRHLRRQNQGLLEGFIVVRPEIDGFLVDVREQFLGHAVHADLGVSHGGGRVAVAGAKVSLAVDQRVTHGEILGHTHDGFVDRRIAVGVILTDDVTHDAGGLLVGGTVGVTQLSHGEQYASVYRFEAIAHVGQSPADNDAHRIVDIGRTHLLFDRDGLDVFVRLNGRHGLFVFHSH